MSAPSERGIPHEAIWYTPLRVTEGFPSQEVEYKRHLETTQMPAGAEHLRHTIAWPFNDAIMHNSHTVITSYYSPKHPYIEITTPQNRSHVIRSPVEATGRILRDLSTGLFTLVLSSDSTKVTVVLKELQTIISFNEADFSHSSELFPVTEGAILGNLREPPFNCVAVGLAYKPHGFGLQPEREELIDPLPFLGRLY